MDDKALILKFIEFLNVSHGCRLEITEWPDKNKRDKKDIDAIAESEDIKLAIEHTSIDPTKNQRRDSNRFIQAIGNIEKEQKNDLSFYLRITVPYKAIKRGQDWGKINTHFKNWIINDAPLLRDGNYIMTNVKGIPFNFIVLKSQEKSPNLVFYRTSPSESSLPQRLVELVERKIQKLNAYAKAGYDTILLLELKDEVHLNDTIIQNIISSEYGSKLPAGLTQVWVCYSSIPQNLEFIKVADQRQVR